MTPCLFFCSLSLVAQNNNPQNNNPCSTTIHSAISTINSVTKVVSDSNEIAANVTSAVDGLTSAVSNFQDFAESRTSSAAIMTYIAYAVVATIFIVTTAVITFDSCQWVKRKFMNWKFPNLNCPDISLELGTR